ncbi:hypothetical protein EX895_003552 [Sporisorium graminicola]|uniref:SAM-dependent MTase RsmB/NOP-type domain-containing protein n=1 Tax=Sporisorium graminicola TaxID=280036 RepID=A0A4U7KVV5_9BASI|nr:hypothetical protein EX895_003552 [Sporisorium graminicola]TKY87538.1 hypothetical protein EX895_003552 [Sporisorium graminicola]
MADFYIRSAKALDRVLRDECSVKAAAAPHPDSGRVLAILINSLAYRSALSHALDESKVIKLEDRTFTLSPPPANKGKDPKFNAKGKGKEAVPKSQSQSKPSKGDYPSKEAFLLVLCHDLLFQSRGIQASKTWPPKVTLERYRASLHSSLVKLQIRQGKSRIQDLRSGALYQEMTARMPRWIRINSLRATCQEVFDWLSENRYTQVLPGVQELGNIKEFAESLHVPGLLAFHPKATSALLKSEMYRDNWVVMQDLASCFPAFILDPPQGGMVVDATSAPGNKTSHLSAIMFSKRSASPVLNGEEAGRIDAFERDAVRYKTLVKRLTAVGALADKAAGGNVVAQRKDFLTTNPADFPLVTHMLLDPSCSGTGIVNRLDFLKEDDDVENDADDSPSSPGAEESTSKLARRLHQLSEFQLLMIRHAFKFPALRKVVYSTCSIHATENEAVVLRALDTDEASEFNWALAPRADVIPSWPVRGDKAACAGRLDVADSVIRCIPGGRGDGDRPHVESCNGFFVACFVRRDHDAERTHKVASAKRTVDDIDDVDNVEADESDDDDNDDDEEHRGNHDQAQAPKASRNAAANRKKKLQKRRKKQRLQQSSSA